MNKDLGSGFVLKIVSSEESKDDVYDIVLYSYNKILFAISKKCFGRKSALYWFDTAYNQLKKIIIVADTIKENKGTDDEQFLTNWLSELLKFWGTDNDLYKKLKKVVSDYLNI